MIERYGQQVTGAAPGEVLRLAARLANGAQQVDVTSIDAGLLRAAATLLEAQKVSFIPITGRYGSVLDATPVADFVRRDLERYRSQRDEFERIRRGFADAGVETMVFKSTGAVPSFHYLSSNLDILVPEGRARIGRKVLIDLGYVELLNVEEPQKFLFRRFPGDGSSFAFHLHEVVGWGVPFLDNAPLWAHARHPSDDPEILIPDPSHALLITLAHWFYEDKAVSLGNLMLTAHALRSMDEALAEPAAHARRRGWEEGFWGALCVFDQAWAHLYGEPFLSGEQRAELDRAPARYAEVRTRLLPLVSYDGNDLAATIPFRANKVAYYRKVMRDRGRSDGRKLLDVYDTLVWAVRWKLRVKSQPALLVTLSGCDGSGKSLQSERLRAAFETCDVRVRMVWARGASSKGVGSVLRAGKSVLRRREASASGADGSAGQSASAGGTDGGPPPRAGTSTVGVVGDRTRAAGEAARFEERQRRLRNPLARWVFSVVYACDLAWPYVVQTRRHMLSGHVVICDRHICDALVDYALFTGTDPARPPLSLKVLHTMVPRPNVGVLLDVEPAEALRRKPEEGGTAHLEAGRKMFIELATARRLTILPPAASADEITRLITRSALTEFYSRYGTLINWLLRSNPGQMNPRDPA